MMLTVAKLRTESQLSSNRSEIPTFTILTATPRKRDPKWQQTITRHPAATGIFSAFQLC